MRKSAQSESHAGTALAPGSRFPRVKSRDVGTSSRRKRSCKALVSALSPTGVEPQLDRGQGAVDAPPPLQPRPEPLLRARPGVAVDAGDRGRGARALWCCSHSAMRSAPRGGTSGLPTWRRSAPRRLCASYTRGCSSRRSSSRTSRTPGIWGRRSTEYSPWAEGSHVELVGAPPVGATILGLVRQGRNDHSVTGATHGVVAPKGSTCATMCASTTPTSPLSSSRGAWPRLPGGLSRSSSTALAYSGDTGGPLRPRRGRRAA
jgi:hypothetical protein